MFAKAAGVPVTELDALVSSGQLLAKDVLPQFGVELRKAANAGGALEEKLYTTRVQQGRFFNEMEQFQNRIFKGGMDKGGANLFNTLTILLQENEIAAAQLGKAFKFVFDVIAASSKIAIPIIASLATTLGSVSSVMNEVFINKQGAMLAGIGAIILAFKRWDLVSKSIAMRLLAVFALMDEIIAPFISGRMGLIEMAIGEDLALADSDLFKGMKDWFSDDADWKKNLSSWDRAIVNSTQALLKFALAVGAASLMFPPFRKMLAGIINKGSPSKAGRATAASINRNRSSRVTPSASGGATTPRASSLGGSSLMGRLGPAGALVGATLGSRADHLYNDRGDYVGHGSDTTFMDRITDVWKGISGDPSALLDRYKGESNREQAINNTRHTNTNRNMNSFVFDQKVEVINAEGMDTERLSQEIKYKTQTQIEDFWFRQMQQNYSGRN